jgi:UDP:flavonoid glycosyltransferase YjiC (YdhE family)
MSRHEKSHANVLEDGRVHLHLHKFQHKTRYNPQHFANDGTRKHARFDFNFRGRHRTYDPIPDAFSGVPRMSIAILITGSRGDVQPFIVLGQALEASPYHHRVRIGTHPVFRELVQENGLEFFSIGGDPAQLMSYMVRNPGILPSIATIRTGEIGQRKAELEEMLLGAWRACTEARDESTSFDGTKTGPMQPFVADCIISNPPTYASLHIAERLAIPLHMMFTMPWSPTTVFPHPLARLETDRTNAAMINYLSYTRIELLTWLGLADIINRFRRHTLLLGAIDPAWGTTLMSHLKVPYTYCWSPALIPKPADWSDHIDVSGFFFLPLAKSYVPDPDLKTFLDVGDTPIYIGFGSIVVDDPESFSQLIFEAVERAGVRALVSRGWSNVGGTNVSDNIFLLGNVPHDWLFQHVSAVVHHGGAGTCAIGLALGKPTVIVPFFGDQFWWAEMVARTGAGPQAVPYKKLTAAVLARKIKEALQPTVSSKASKLAEKIQREDGIGRATEHFHTAQRTERFACFLCPDRVAAWRVRRSNIQLSALAVAVIMKNRRLEPADLKL